MYNKRRYKYASISAASILAKTSDDYIEDLLEKTPDLDKYGWEDKYVLNRHTWMRQKNMELYIIENHLN